MDAISKKPLQNTTSNALYKDIYAHLVKGANERNTSKVTDFLYAANKTLSLVAKEENKRNWQYSEMVIVPIISNLGDYFSKYSFEEYKSGIISLELSPKFELSAEFDTSTSSKLRQNGLGCMIWNILTDIPEKLRAFAKQPLNARKVYAKQEDADNLNNAIFSLNKGMLELQKVMETNEMSYGKEIVNYAINLTAPIIRILSHQTSQEYMQEKIVPHFNRQPNYDKCLFITDFLLYK